MYRTQGSEGYCSYASVSLHLAIESTGTYLWLNDLQVPDLDATGCEVGDLELNVNRPLRLASTHTTHTSSESTHHTTALLIVTTYGGQTKFSAHQEFFATSKLLDLPYNRRCLWRVMYCTDICAEARCVGVFRYGYRDLHIVRCASPLKLCFCLCFSLVRFRKV